MTQVIAGGGEIDIVNFIGKHECSKVPPSLYDDDGAIEEVPNQVLSRH